jgi:hypothetical protein
MYLTCKSNREQHTMKALQKISITLVAICLLFTTTNAQDVIRQQACKDGFIAQQIDSLKKLMAEKNFIVVKEATMNMESQFEMPVVLPLQEGTWYHVVFIGDIESKLYEMRMFDWNEKMVAYHKKKWGDVDGNIIAYDYIPRFSEYHMLKPVQVNSKKKNMCGYIMLLKRVKAP